MSQKSVKYKCSEISEMMSICKVRKECGRSCTGCDYNRKGYKICRDMLGQYNKMSWAQQISIVVKSKNM